MKFTVTKPVQVDATFIYILPGELFTLEVFNRVTGKNYSCWWDVLVDNPALINTNGEPYLMVNIETGQIINWYKDGTVGDFNNVKIVDTGTYTLKDAHMTDIVTYNDYVPGFLSINEPGYGDYWEFNVDENGYIQNWKFDQSSVDILYRL